MTACPQCGVDLPKFDGPTHRYFGASSACWAAYGIILEREYSNPKFFKNHRMTVDAYALQHPGDSSLQAVQSVNLHLISSTLLFEYKTSANMALDAMRKLSAASKKNAKLFSWLAPPSTLGQITVKDVLPKTQVDEHLKQIEKWAKCTWQAWVDHHHIAKNHLKTFEII